MARRDPCGLACGHYRLAGQEQIGAVRAIKLVFYDHYSTDPAVTPNSCLAPLFLPPYYAVKMIPSDLGSKGGLLTDARARVLRPDGSVIGGLYAAGTPAPP